MPDSSALRRTAGWVTVAIGGIGLVVPIIMIRGQFGRAPGAANAGTYFETASLFHIPVWIIVGLALVLFGFAIMAPADDPDEAKEAVAASTPHQGSPDGSSSRDSLDDVHLDEREEV